MEPPAEITQLLIAWNQGEKVLAQMNNFRDVREHRRQALEINESLAAQDPANVRAQQRLSQSHEDVVQALRATGDLARAVEHLRRALAIEDSLARNKFSIAPARTRLAKSHEEVAEFLSGGATRQGP